MTELQSIGKLMVAVTTFRRSGDGVSAGREPEDGALSCTRIQGILCIGVPHRTRTALVGLVPSCQLLLFKSAGRQGTHTTVLPLSCGVAEGWALCVVAMRALDLVLAHAVPGGSAALRQTRV